MGRQALCFIQRVNTDITHGFYKYICCDQNTNQKQSNLSHRGHWHFWLTADIHKKVSWSIFLSMSIPIKADRALEPTYKCACFRHSGLWSHGGVLQVDGWGFTQQKHFVGHLGLHWEIGGKTVMLCRWKSLPYVEICHGIQTTWWKVSSTGKCCQNPVGFTRLETFRSG